MKTSLALALAFTTLFAIAQNKANYTNIDVTCIKPDWMKDDLKTVVFQNRDSLTVVRSLDGWVKATEKFNKPAVLVRVTSTGTEYYYNCYAILDKRNIFPPNYKLPTISDFNSAQIDIDGHNYYGKDEEKTLHLIPSVAIEYDQVNTKAYFTPIENTTITLWTADSYPGENELWKTVTIKQDTYGVTVSSTHAPKTYGYKVRAVEEIEFTLKNKIFDYKCLLPENYDYIKDSVTRKIQKDYTIKLNEKLVVTIEILIDKGGGNKSRIVSISSKKLSKGLLKDIEGIVKKIPIAPYYKGFSLSAKSLLTIELTSTKYLKEVKSKTAKTHKDKNSNRTKTGEKGAAVAIEKNVLNSEGKLRRLPEPYSTILTVIPANEEVEVLLRSREMNGYVYVRYKGISGYINEIYLSRQRVQTSNDKGIKLKASKAKVNTRAKAERKEKSNEKWRKTPKRTIAISNQSIDGLSVGARLGYPASVLQVKHLFNDKYGRPLHGVDATLNIGEWVDANFVYCYHYNMIKQRFSFKLYAGGGMGFGTYFKESPINRNRSYYGNTYNYTVDRRRITLLPVAGMEWTPARARGHLKIAFDYRPSIDFLHPSFVVWWNLGWSFRYNF